MTVTINRYRWANQNSLLLHCDGVDGSTTIADASKYTHVVTTNGNTQIDTAQSKFGGASLLFDGVSDNATVPGHASLNFGSGDFTVDLWVRTATVAAGVGTVVTSRDALTTDIPFHIIRSAATYRFYCSSPAALYDIASNLSMGVATANTWQHLAVTRSGNNWKLFNDGALITSFTSTLVIADIASTLQFGAQNGTSFEFEGHLDEIRMTKGTARWTAAFTPPTIAEA